MPTDIQLGTMRLDEVGHVAGLAARALRDNPMSLAVFGRSERKRARDLETTFLWVLSAANRPAMVARRDDVVVGLAATAPAGECFIRQTLARRKVFRAGSQAVAVGVPSMPRGLVLPLLRMGVGALHRMSTWGSANADHDPEEAHQHVELVAVEPGLQRMGIGRMMMERTLTEMATKPGYPHLETDTEHNVRFYESLGFEITATVQLFGVTNYYMDLGKPSHAPTAG